MLAFGEAFGAKAGNPEVELNKADQIPRCAPNEQPKYQTELRKRGGAEARRKIWSEVANCVPAESSVTRSPPPNLPPRLRASAFKTFLFIPVSTCPPRAWLGMTPWRLPTSFSTPFSARSDPATIKGPPPPPPPPLSAQQTPRH